MSIYMHYLTKAAICSQIRTFKKKFCCHLFFFKLWKKKIKLMDILTLIHLTSFTHLKRLSPEVPRFYYAKKILFFRQNRCYYFFFFFLQKPYQPKFNFFFFSKFQILRNKKTRRRRFFLQDIDAAAHAQFNFDVLENKDRPQFKYCVGN